MNLEENKDKGLYIISSPYHQLNNIRKFGRSDRLNERVHDYNVGGEYYEVAFILFNNETNEIHRLEQKVLEAIKKYHPKYLRLNKEWNNG